MKLRPFNGSSSTCCWLTSCDNEALSVSSVTACAVTCRVSVTAPGFKATSMRSFWLTVSVIVLVTDF